MNKIITAFTIASCVISISTFAQESSVSSIGITQEAKGTSSYNKLVEWAVAGMVKRARPGSRRFPVFNIKKYPDALESYEDGLNRYHSIAKSAINVAFDENEQPLFGGKYGRHKTLALILSIASWESSYKKHVDYNISPQARGDSGKSWCLMQVNLGKPICINDNGSRIRLVNGECEGKWSTPSRVVLHDDTIDIVSDQNADGSYSGQDLIKDRELCFRVGLRIIKKSFMACRNNEYENKLAAYTSGSCDKGFVESRRRILSMSSWMSLSFRPMISPISYTDHNQIVD